MPLRSGTLRRQGFCSRFNFTPLWAPCDGILVDPSLLWGPKVSLRAIHYTPSRSTGGCWVVLSVLFVLSGKKKVSTNCERTLIFVFCPSLPHATYTPNKSAPPKSFFVRPLHQNSLPPGRPRFTAKETSRMCCTLCSAHNPRFPLFAAIRYRAFPEHASVGLLQCSVIENAALAQAALRAIPDLEALYSLLKGRLSDAGGPGDQPQAGPVSDEQVSGRARSDALQGHALCVRRCAGGGVGGREGRPLCVTPSESHHQPPPPPPPPTHNRPREWKGKEW